MKLTDAEQAMVDDIRVNWAISDRKRDESLMEPEEIVAYRDLSYGPYGKENLLDIYIRRDTVGQKMPTIVNIHGGAWVYGCKEIYKHYCMRLALKGFTVVNINYRLAPETLFPGAVEDINAVLAFVAAHDGEYGLDKQRVILVGDSAGGQMVLHYAAIFTNPKFADLFDLPLPQIDLRAVGLNCGAYDGKHMVESHDDLAFRIYTGLSGEAVPTQKLIEQVDALSAVTKAFPPAFVMSSYGDFLLSQAEPMYQLLKSKGVPAKMKIYGSTDHPEIGHVFHVDCKLSEAAICNEDECNFFKQYV